MTPPETAQRTIRKLAPPIPSETIMPLEVIHSALVVAFFAVWAMAGAIVVRKT